MSAADLSADVLAVLGLAAPISLDELQENAELGTRIDRKYVVDWPTLTELMRSLTATHRVLEIDGHRIFNYESVYFDSAGLGAFRAHLQRRRRRYKVRARHYVDSGLTMLEVKLKGKRGETIKHRMPYDGEELSHLNAEALAFLATRLAEVYPGMEVPALAPILRNRYRRITMTCDSERVTYDFALSFGDDGERLGLDARYAIVESKAQHRLGVADRELRRLGVQPVSCSKYCVGVGLLREDVKANELRWLLNRYFRSGEHTAQSPQLQTGAAIDA